MALNSPASRGLLLLYGLVAWLVCCLASLTHCIVVWEIFVQQLQAPMLQGSSSAGLERGLQDSQRLFNTAVKAQRGIKPSWNLCKSLGTSFDLESFWTMVTYGSFAALCCIKRAFKCHPFYLTRSFLQHSSFMTTIYVSKMTETPNSEFSFLMESLFRCYYW